MTSIEQQAVLIDIRPELVPDDVAEEHDLATLEDLLIEALEGIGECDGNEVGPDLATIYLYGYDANLVFRTIEPILRAYPLTRDAVVRLRYGEPGAPEKAVLLSTLSMP